MIIDQLPSLNNTTNTDELPIERGTNTYKITFQTLFSTINSALSTAITDLQTLIAAKVAKAGDTMTGELVIDDAGISISTDDAEIATSRSTTVTRPIINIKDKNNTVVGWLRGLFRTDGRSGIQFGAQRGTYSNAIALELDNNNAAVVTLGSTVAWRRALLLGTDGALPITIAQGGTGQTGVNTSTVVSDLVASDATGFSTQAVSFKTWGKIAQIAIGFKVSSTGSVSNKKVCTLVTGAKPSGTTSCLFDTNVISYAYISTAGEVYVTGNFSSTSTTYYIRAIYLLA